MSRAEVGKAMGLSYERVRQLELLALKHLREQGGDVEGDEESDDLEYELPPRPRVRLRVIAEQGTLPL